MKTIAPKQAVQDEAGQDQTVPESAVPEAVAPEFAVPVISTVRILKIATCPSLSARSTLTYHLGCYRRNIAPDSGSPDPTEHGTTEHVATKPVPTASEVQIRVFANSAAGFFSSEWVSLDSIQMQFANARDEKAITSNLLFPLFKGKSANTQAFLFAVLKSAGLVRAVKDAKRLYEVVDTGAFMGAFKALMASGVELQVEEKLVKATLQVNGKVAIKPKAAPVTKPGKAKPKGAR